MTPEKLLEFIINECDSRIGQIERRGSSAIPLKEFRDFLDNLNQLVGDPE